MRRPSDSDPLSAWGLMASPSVELGADIQAGRSTAIAWEFH